VALRISRTVFSALSGMRLFACLIVAPQRGYDAPAILSYAISSFCPTSADGLQQQNLYDLKSQELGFFDVILFSGVLYHLRYPFWGLKVLRDMMKPGGELLIETAIWRGDPNNAMLFCPIENDSPYEPTSCTFFNVKGLVDTLKSLNFDTMEVEFLSPRSGRDRIARLQMSWAQLTRIALTRLRTQLDRIALAGGNRPKITNVTRAVFHSRFGEHEKDSIITRYWEK